MGAQCANKEEHIADFRFTPYGERQSAAAEDKGRTKKKEGNPKGKTKAITGRELPNAANRQAQKKEG